MNEDSNLRPIHSHSSRKRPHREISGPHSDPQNRSAWTQHAEASSSVGRPDPQTHDLPPLSSVQQLRYPGDGLDFRRPVMSTGVSSPPPAYRIPRGEDVIDLTQDSDPTPLSGRPSGWDEASASRASRGPRFGREIMSDIVDLEAESPSSNSQQQQQQQPSSPEIQFLGSSARAEAPRAGTRHRYGWAQPDHSRLFLGGTNLMNLLRGIHRAGDETAYNQEQLLRHEIALRTRDIRVFREQTRRALWNTTPRQNGVDLTIDLDNEVPIQLDYSTTGFNGGLPVRAESIYEPPGPASEGFTRTAQEDDEVVCPNCEHELGTGDDPQNQIWVVRACGHVYCGTCTKNRSASSRGKKHDPPPPGVNARPFAKCVVADCGKPVSQPKTMLQIYL